MKNNTFTGPLIIGAFEKRAPEHQEPDCMFSTGDRSRLQFFSIIL